MYTPQLQISPNAFLDGAVSPQVIADISNRLVAALRAYPHFAVLKGAPPTEDRTLTVQLARAIASIDPVRDGQTPDQRGKVSFTRVRINSARAHQVSAVTHYSRTNEALEPHTDSSYQAEPHELVAFQIVRADVDGGDTLMAPVEHVIDALDNDVREVLKRRKFPFGRGAHPVLWKSGGDFRIRYYRSQIEAAREKDNRLTDDDLAALATLDEVLRREDRLFRFHVEAGETIFIHNTKTLHGRSGFATNSDRLLYRIRIHAGCLG